MVRVVVKLFEFSTSGVVPVAGSIVQVDVAIVSEVSRSAHSMAKASTSSGSFESQPLRIELATYSSAVTSRTAAGT